MKHYRRLPKHFYEMAFADFSLTEWDRQGKIFKTFISIMKKNYTDGYEKLYKMNQYNDEAVYEVYRWFRHIFIPKFHIYFGFGRETSTGKKQLTYNSKDLENFKVYLNSIANMELITFRGVNQTLGKLFDIDMSNDFLWLVSHLFNIENWDYPIDNVKEPIQLKQIDIETLSRDLPYYLKKSLGKLNTAYANYSKINKFVHEMNSKKILPSIENPEEKFIYKGVKYVIRMSPEATEREKQYAADPGTKNILNLYLDILEKHRLLKYVEKKCDKIIIADRVAFKATASKKSDNAYAYYSPREHNIYMPIIGIPDAFFAEAFIHEVGHLIFNYVKTDCGHPGLQAWEQWEYDYIQWNRKKSKNMLPSEYAYHNEKEAFAEMFAWNYCPKKFLHASMHKPSDHIQAQFEAYMGLLK